MHTIGFDTETELAAPGTIPRLVCLTLAVFNDGDEDLPDDLRLDLVGESRDGTTRYIVSAADAPRVMHALLDAYGHSYRSLRLVSHNAAFDVAVLSKADPTLHFRLVDLANQGGISDTMIREMLFCISRGWLHYDPRTRNKRGGDEDETVRLALWEPVLARLGRDIREDKVKLDRLQDVPRNQWPWRYRYIDLLDTPLSRWPVEARQYAMEDAALHLQVWHAQAMEPPVDGYPLVINDDSPMDGMFVNEAEQVRASLVFHDMGVRGIRIDSAQAQVFIANVRDKIQASDDAAAALGITRVNRCKVCEGTGLLGDPPNLAPCRVCGGVPAPLRASDSATLSSRLRSWVSHCFGGQPPMTKPSGRFPEGQIKADNETLLATGHPSLVAYAQAGEWRKLLSTYVPIVEGALNGDAPMLYPAWNVLVATGRGSCAHPNLQNPPKVGGYRECFVPDQDGWVFCSCDYSSQELVCLAQTTLDLLRDTPGLEFRLTEANNNGHDFHLAFWLPTLGISYEQAEALYASGDKAMKDRRQSAKPANFGFPGGMGIATFQDYARGYGLDLTLTEAEDLRNGWFAAWTEMRPYMRLFADAARRAPDGRFTIQQLPSGRVRGNVSYSEAANSMFQGRGADATKAAMWEVYMECTFGISNLWSGPTPSPLHGCRLTAAIHDELIVQGPEDTASAWAQRLRQVMEQAMQPIVPDQRVVAEPALMPRWFKGAEALWLDGDLLVWYPPAPGDKPCKGQMTDEMAQRYMRAVEAYYG